MPRAKESLKEKKAYLKNRANVAHQNPGDPATAAEENVAAKKVAAAEKELSGCEESLKEDLAEIEKDGKDKNLEKTLERLRNDYIRALSRNLYSN